MVMTTGNEQLPNNGIVNPTPVAAGAQNRRDAAGPLGTVNGGPTSSTTLAPPTVAPAPAPAPAKVPGSMDRPGGIVNQAITQPRTDQRQLPAATTSPVGPGSMQRPPNQAPLPGDLNPKPVTPSPQPSPTPSPQPSGTTSQSFQSAAVQGVPGSVAPTGEQAISNWMNGQPMEPGLSAAVINSAFSLGGLDPLSVNHYLAGGAAGYLPSSPRDFGWTLSPDGKNWTAPGGGNTANGITWNPQTQRFEGDPRAAAAAGATGSQQYNQAQGSAGAGGAGGIVNSAIGGTPQNTGAPGAPGAGGGVNPQTGQPYTAGGSNVVNGTDLSQFAPGTTEYNPVMGQVEQNQTVQGQLGDILKAGSPLLEAAKARAMQQANARGLQNSSMAAQAGEEAVVNTALPIAQADAAAYQKQALVNQDITNQFLSMKEGAQLDLQKAYEAFKQNNFMFDKDEKLKRYLNDSQISSQEKVAAMQAAAQISAAQIHADASLKAATMQADTELKATGMRISAEQVIEQARLTSTEKINLANLSQSAFTNYVAGMNNILGTQMEPADKDKWIKDYNTFWAGNGYLKDAGITIKLPGG